MHPILFEIGSFKLHTFGLLMIAAFFAGLWLARKRAPKYGLAPDKITDMSFFALLFGILGARVVFILQELPHYLAHRDELLSIQFQGLTSFGGILFGFGYLAVWAVRHKVSFLSLLDMMIAPLLLGQAIGRVGCLMNGCCFGGACPTGTPWGIHVDGMIGLYHPAQIYESLMDIAGLLILFALEKRGLNKGQSFGAGLILYGLARFIYEYWRAGFSSTYLPGLKITDAQAAAGSMVIIGLAVFLVFRNRAHSQQEIPA